MCITLEELFFLVLFLLFVVLGCFAVLAVLISNLADRVTQYKRFLKSLSMGFYSFEKILKETKKTLDK